MASKNQYGRDWAPVRRVLDRPHGASAGEFAQVLDELAGTGVIAPADADTFLSNPEAAKVAGEALFDAFMLAAKAVEAGVRHGLYNDLAAMARALAPAGGLTRAAVEFLSRLLDRYASRPQEAVQASLGFEALLAGMSSPAADIAETCLLQLSLRMDCLSPEERQKLVHAIDHLPDLIKQGRLARGTLRHHRLLEDLAQAGQHQGQLPGNAVVVSVHSHKGGVGKTVIALALAHYLEKEKQARVCIVDMDDEGPSLHFNVPVKPETQENLWFFSDWFCDGRTDIPDGLLQKTDGYNLTYIAGSLYSADFDQLDAFQRGHRPPAGKYSTLRERMELLLCELVKKYKFTHIIIDTAPGLAHLSYEIMMTTIGLGGRLVFVMRPRATDILPFCSDWESLPRRFNIPLALVVNQVDTASRKLLEDNRALSEALVQLPQFRAYAPKLGMWRPEELIKWFVGLLNEFEGRRFIVEHTGILTHVADVHTSTSGTLDGVKECREMMEVAGKISQVLGLTMERRVRVQGVGRRKK